MQYHDVIYFKFIIVIAILGYLALGATLFK